MICIALLRSQKEMTSHLDENSPVETLPKITLLIAAYNEESSIENKILNSLDLNYPSGLLEILVFSDGSTDRTDMIVQKYKRTGVSLLRYEGRKGKTACQNLAVKGAKGDVIVYSDATSLLNSNSLFSIVNKFNDKSVGCVVGELTSSLDTNRKGVAVEETFFLKFSQWVKKLESSAAMPVGGSGALFAIRSDLVCELPADANDDLLRPLHVVFCGHRIVYDRGARAVEVFQEDYSDIFSKKIRIAERAVQSIKLSVAILNPFRYGLFSLQFLTKVLLRRLVLPVLVIYILSGMTLYFLTGLSAIVLLLCPPLLIVFLSFNGARGKGIFSEDKLGISKVSEFCYYYLLSITGAFIGVVKGIRGRKVTSWSGDTDGL